jgi:uncharacterized membrane protein YkvA (DUF1232 family)
MKNKVFDKVLDRLSQSNQDDYLNNPKKTQALLGRAAKLFSGIKGSIEVGSDIHLIWPLMQDYMGGRYTQLSKTFLVSLIATLIYFVSPIDAIPDFIPILGWSDDIAVFLYVLDKFKKEMAAYKLWRASQTESLDPQPATKDMTDVTE